MTAPVQYLRRIWCTLRREDMPITRVDEKADLDRPYTGREYVTYSIIADGVGKEAQSAWEELIRTDVKADRAVGALVGLAIGDAVGHPLEFLPADGRAAKPDRPFRLKKDRRDDAGRYAWMDFTADGNITYTEEFNKFRLHPGQWTDDCSMALCLADSLLVHPHYQGGDCRARYHFWWHHGYNNAFRFDTRPRTSCGLGGNISKSLNELMDYAELPTAKVPEEFDASGEDAGNGSIMRLAAVPIRFWNDLPNGFRVAMKQSRATHPGNDAAACCTFITFFVSRAISRDPTDTTPVQTFLSDTIQLYLANPPTTDSGVAKLKLLLTCSPPGATEACWDWRKQDLAIAETLKARGRKYNGYPVDEGYFGAYCMDGLAMALWGLNRSNSYAETIYNVVNLMGDADTTGAICGQMAGAFYGYSAIATQKYSSRMLENLYQWDCNREIPLRAALLYLSEEFLKDGPPPRG